MPGSRKSRWQVGTVSGLVAGGALVAACGDGGGPGFRTSVNQAEAEALAGYMYVELYQRLAALEAFQTDDPNVFTFPIPNPGCMPAMSDPTNADSDGDGVLDDQTFTFTDANCPGQSGTASISGTHRIQDTDGGNTIFGYRVTFRNLRRTSVPGGGPGQPAPVFSVTDGYYGTTVTAAGATFNESLSYHYQDLSQNPPAYDVRVQLALTASFTPTSGTMDPASGEFPAGTFVIQGSYDWDGNHRELTGPFHFDVSTTVPLGIDPACPPPLRGGELRFAITATGGRTGFTVRPQGCSSFIDVVAFDERP